MNAITVSKLGKEYVLGGRTAGYETLRDRLAGILRHRPEAERGGSRFWALRDVDLEVPHGDVLAVVGRNGAGKSTLLKILSRITAPTTGQARIHGRLASLLEVGTGFHAELTGRENIYLNGTILGMSRSEITSRFDEIVAFAGIEKFLDTPAKRYSSGMYVRLAFAVAAHVDADVLLVDEVLSVGDAQFQKKCMGKMGEVSRSGRTVLFVSHNMAAVQALCRSALWLEGGRVQCYGEVQPVVTKYLGEVMDDCREREWPHLDEAPGNDHVRIRRMSVRSVDGVRGTAITVDTPVVLEFELWNLVENAHLNFSVRFYDEQGVVAFASVSFREPRWHGKPFPRGLFSIACAIPGGLLNAGHYRADFIVQLDQNEVIFEDEHAITFEVADVMDQNRHWYGKWQGAVRPDLKWSTQLIESGSPFVEGRAGRR